jgi:hypothetical protein
MVMMKQLDDNHSTFPMKTLAGALVLVSVASVAACGAKADDASAPSLTVTISGEGAALTGFAFPPSSSDDLAFVDGWDVTFDRILVTVGEITLADDPDTSPTDQAQTGAVVARATGPWAVDVSKPAAATGVDPKAGSGSLADPSPASSDLVGKDPHAQPLARVDTLDGGRRFDPSRRYAFGFDVVAATAAAKHMNLDASAAADYAEMVDKGLSVLYVGTATFKGATCAQSDASSETPYDFGKLPTTVKFRLGFKTPTRYQNCQNTDLRGKPFDGEEAQRGVQVSGPTTAQITLHVDHPFWNTVDHDAAELYFDQMAAAASPDGMLVIDDLSALDFTSFEDRSGAALPWRSCVADKRVKPGVRKFDSGSVPVDPSGAPSSALRSYADYVTYQQSTQGHLNADGLCAVERQFASPR